MFNPEQDETWQKLHELINIGSTTNLRRDNDVSIGNRESSVGRGMMSQGDFSSINYSSNTRKES